MSLGIVKTAYTNLVTEGCDTYNQDLTAEQSAEWAEHARKEDAARAEAMTVLIKLIGQDRAERASKHFGGDATRALKLAREQIAAGKCKAA